ncbi:hypothetical protein Cfor_09710 [Coptotermes formosanus]|uniref:Uncharacterized protein n=1 Tax=Coptotermes formosanus TaxID=36987 RepID=A0A6L2PWC5_COPFO|nr:hypothetical protein Cfor_09710 [Coptotermes formosanus]
MKPAFLMLLLATLVPNTTPLKMQERHLALCICSIFRHHFVTEQTLLLSTIEDADFMDFLLEKLHDTSNWPLQVFSNGAMIPFQGDHQKIWNYLILSRGHEDIEEQTDKLTDNAGWTYEARFLVVVMGRGSTPRQQALSVVQELWDNIRALNVVVLVRLDTVFHLYTWFPYQPNEQCDDVTDVVLINEWNLEGEGKLVNNGPLYPHKIPSDFQGCPFKVSMPHHAVVEVPYVIAFSKLYNVTPIIQFKHTNDAFLADAIRESLEDIVLGSSAAAIGGIPLLIAATNLGQPSFPYYEIQYVWYVPCSRPLSRLLAVSKIFSVPLWIAVVAMMILVPAVMWSLSNCSLQQQSQERMPNVFYNIWAIYMGVSVTEMPRTFRLRALILPWICYCLAISTVFQAFFTSYLVNPGIDSQITTLEELIEKEMEFGFRNEITNYYKQSHFEIHKKVSKRGKNCVQTHLCIQRIIDTGAYATVAESWSVDNVMLLMNHTNRVCRMNDIDSFPIKIVAYFSKGSILLNTFNKMITSLVETGIITKVDRERKERPVAHRIGDTDTQDDYFVFTLSHLQIAFHLTVKYSHVNRGRSVHVDILCTLCKAQ